jgi:hypothetical protein
VTDERNAAGAATTVSGPAVTGVLPPGRLRLLHVLALGTWISGGVWLIFDYFVRSIDQFGFEVPHPQQRWWLIAHAAFSFGALWMFGALWPDHVVRGWRAGLLRRSGGTLFAALVWLTVTGCALYYLGNDTLRSWTALAHWIPGLALLVVFFIHAPWGRARRADRRR